MKEDLRLLGKEERQALCATTAFHRKAESINGNYSKPCQGNEHTGCYGNMRKCQVKRLMPSLIIPG